MKAGASIDFVSFPAITQAQLNAYAEASGDPNPIHLDEAVAKKAGLPGVIAHGMLIAALVSERALRYAEAKGGSPDWRISVSRMRFRAMTLLGDVVSVGGVVKDSTEHEAILELQARNQRGETVVQGTIHFAK